jgi:GNAT superfamily N-acetyltransferase
MTTGTPSVRTARTGEAPALGRLIATAFSHLPVSRWLVPEPDERVPAMGGQFEMVVAHGIQHGDVYVSDEGPGVAVWFPPGEMPEIENYGERLAAACGPYAERFAELDDAMHHAHPSAPDHAYLAFLAVAEPGRDRGVGSALLEAHHQRLDADGLPAYLDASGLDSRRLYLRHGYTDHAPPYGPGGLREFCPMWREPG